MSGKALKRAGAVVALAVVVAGLLWLILNVFLQNLGRSVAARVNSETVYSNEAAVYYELMLDEMEQMAGEEFYELTILGTEPEQLAMDRALSSLVKVKAAQSVAGGTLDEAELSDMAEKVEQLKTILGEDKLEAYALDDELLTDIVTENYLVYRYEKNADFILTEIATDIETAMQKRYETYDTQDTGVYLRRVKVQVLLFSTGQMVEGEWTSYAEIQKEQILETVEEVHEKMMSGRLHFKTAGIQYASETKVSEIPAFTEGEVLCPDMDEGYVYYGQMDRELADAIFSLEVGEISDIIETQYGYLIAEADEFSEATVRDVQEYSSQLQRAKENYRSQLVEELREQRLDEEWERLVSESTVTLYQEEFSKYLKENRP